VKAALMLVGGVALLALVVFVAFTVGARRVVETAAPVVKAIEQQTAKQLEQNAATATKAAREVMNADDDALLDLFRQQLRDDAATATGQLAPY
jgi:hypothetical protein